MSNYFLPVMQASVWNNLKEVNDVHAIYEALAEPLHEEMYRRQTFDLMDQLTGGQQLLLTYDYIRNQVMQGGFIQLIQNGYVGLLPDMPEWLYGINQPAIAAVIDDALKVFVLNREILSKKTTVEEFALLYRELKEFDGIDERFRENDDAVITTMVQYAIANPDSFITLT